MSDKALILGMIFVVVLLLSQSFVAPLMGSSAQARRRLKGRIRALAEDSEGAQHVSLVKQKYLKKLGPVARFLESAPQLEPLRTLIDQSGHEYLAYHFILFSLASAAAAGLGAGLFLGWKIEALIAVPIGMGIPYFVLQRKRVKRLGKFEEQLPDALSVMARSLQAGLPFSEALKVVSEEMNEPVSKEFGTVFTEINYGGNVRAALLGMLERMPTVAVMAMVSSILIQRETGGNLAEVLDRIGNLVRQRFRFQRSVKTLTAEGKMTAWVVSLMPFGLGGMMALLSPDMMNEFIHDPTGKRMILGGFVVMVVGILWIRKLVSIDV